MLSTTGDALSWYVIHTHPKQEDRTAVNLQAWGMETLSPKLRVNRCNEFSGQISRVARPLFPSYIFARFRFNESYHRVRFTRGVNCVITFNDQPTPLEDQIIDLIRARIESNGFVKTNEDFQAGDEVVINEGRFQNFCGVFEREIEDADRVRILLNTVSFQAHIVVDKAFITRLAGNTIPGSLNGHKDLLSTLYPTC